MRRLLGVLALSTLVLTLVPAPARADLTAFAGVATTPKTRATKGFAVGISLIVIGFEFEYAGVVEHPLDGAPALRTGMLNGVIQTPTHTQFYLTAGGGFFRERLGSATETNIGTNIGGGVKLGLAGPIRLRVDYRVFSLRGTPIDAHPQRVYAGLNFAF
jgi:hypothetical protein